MKALRTQPSYHLTRHFFSGLFDLGFLSDAGAVSFTRWIIGICAAFMSFGLLLVRIFVAKYGWSQAFQFLHASCESNRQEPSVPPRLV